MRAVVALTERRDLVSAALDWATGQGSEAHSDGDLVQILDPGHRSFLLHESPPEVILEDVRWPSSVERADDIVECRWADFVVAVLTGCAPTSSQSIVVLDGGRSVRDDRSVVAQDLMI